MKVLHIIASANLAARPNRRRLFEFRGLVPPRSCAPHCVSGPAKRALASSGAGSDGNAVGLDGADLRPASSAGSWLRYGYSASPRAFAARRCRLLRCGDRQRPVELRLVRRLARLRDMPTPIRVHPRHARSWFNTAYPTKAFFKSIFWRLIEHKVLRDAAGVLFTCEEERQLARRSFMPYQAREFVVGYGTRDVSGGTR